MIISNITPSQVWTASSRSLTNFGSGALAATSTVQTTVAANSQIDLRPSAGTVTHATVAVTTGAGATALIAIQGWDGTFAYPVAVTTATPGNTVGFTMFGTNSVGPRIANTDATHAGTYIVAQFTFTI